MMELDQKTIDKLDAVQTIMGADFSNKKEVEEFATAIVIMRIQEMKDSSKVNPNEIIEKYIKFNTKTETKDRFRSLAGWVSRDGIHSAGKYLAKKPEKTKFFLYRLGFDSIKEFRDWYKSFTKEELEEYTKEYCPGNCCWGIINWLMRHK